MNRINGSVAALSILALCMFTWAATTQVEPAYSQMRIQNAEKLRQYTWKSRVEIKLEGKTKNVQLMLMRYDSRGELQSTLLSGTPGNSPEFGLRGRLAKKKKEGLLKTVEELKAIAVTYGELPMVTLQQLMSAATPVSDGSGQPKLVRAVGTNVLQRGDSVTLWVDAASRGLLKTEIITALDQKAVRVTTEHVDLANGPNTLVRAIVRYPSEELEIVIENFEYVKGTL